MGWGEPAALNHVVSYVYAAADGTDPGNVYYIRSTDSGLTFSAPFQLNANTEALKPSGSPIFRSAMPAPFWPPGRRGTQDICQLSALQSQPTFAIKCIPANRPITV